MCPSSEFQIRCESTRPCESQCRAKLGEMSSTNISILFFLFSFLFFFLSLSVSLSFSLSLDRLTCTKFHRRDTPCPDNFARRRSLHAQFSRSCFTCTRRDLSWIHYACYTKHFEISLAMLWDLAITIILVKFETNLKAYKCELQDISSSNNIHRASIFSAIVLR